MPSPAWRVVLAATVAGLLVGLGLTLLLPTTYRASGTLVLTRQGNAPGEDEELAGAAEVAEGLLRSRAVAESVAANLRLADSPEELLDRIEVDAAARSSLLRLSVNAGEREEARRTAQEVAEVFTVLYNSRFGPAVTASVWEPVRAGADPASPRPVLNLALGALFGLAVGVAIATLRKPGARRRWVPSSGPSDDRIAALTARERALARRAAELSLRERSLQGGPPVEQPRVRPPQARPEAHFVPPGRGEWTMDGVELLVARHGSEFPERAEELTTYVDSIRAVAEPDGRLPAGVEVVVEDVFADLIERARLEAAE